MNAQTVSDELRRWILAQAEAGGRPQELLAAMVRSGWDEELAAEALVQELTARLAQLQHRQQREALPPAAAVPEPASGTALQAGGRVVQVLASMTLPRAVLFGGLLDDDECRALVALARPRLERSQTVDSATGGNEVNAARTSEGMFFERGETPLLAAIEERIAELVRWPVERGEGIQVLRYRPGAEYRPHHDYFDPAHPGTARILARGGQRVATIVIYLEAPAAGGATTFPEVGLEVAPVRGHALFFSYARAHPAGKTLHGGAAVTAGEKWVATKWLRERAFV